MDVMTISAQERETGKGASRALRREKQVPCVLYGSSVDPVALQISEKELKPLIYTTETHVVSIELGDQAWDCILKDVDFHPITDRPMHADFQALQAGELITMTIPVNYIGVPAGKSDGGVTNYVLNELEVRCLPKNIPSYIDVDISALTIGDGIHIGDLDVEGVEFTGLPEKTLVTVIPPRREEEPEEAEEGLVSVVEETLEGEDVEGAEGEEAEGEEA